MSIASAVAEAVEAVSNLLNPAKREVRVLRGAIEAGEELLMILRKEGIYAKMPEKRLKQLEVHYQKQWNAWKDGK